MIAWGVDVDSRAVHVAAWDSQDRQHATWTWRWRERSAKGPWAGADDLERQQQRLIDGIGELRRHEQRGWGYPDVIVVERPTGAHPSPALMASWGLTLVALKVHVGCPVSDVAVSTWKKHSVGHGNASKDQVVDWATEWTAWPVCALGRPEADQADALGVVRWAVETIEFEED